MHAAPAPLEPFAQVHQTRRLGWEAVAADPEPFLSVGLADARWLEAALPSLIEAEARCPTAGDSLTHWYLRSDNLCLGPRGAVIVDWNLACFRTHV